MARWIKMSTKEKIAALQRRLADIQTAQRVLDEFERLTLSKIETLSDEQRDNE